MMQMMVFEFHYYQIGALFINFYLFLEPSNYPLERWNRKSTRQNPIDQ